MTLDVHSQRLVIIVILAWSLGQMYMYYALPKRPLNIEPEAQMLSAPLVRLFGTAEVAIARPSRPRAFTEGSYFSAWAEEFLTSRVLAYESRCAVEVSGLGGGAENIREEEVAHAALVCLLVLRFQKPIWGGEQYCCDYADQDHYKVETLLSGPHCLFAR
jgi:hypothetical protein